MTVRELIEELSKLDPDAQVVVSEAGGDFNYYSTAPSAQPGWFHPGEGESEFWADNEPDEDPDDEYTPVPGDLRAVAIH